MYEGEVAMRYRIEYADGRCCSIAISRKDLLEWLKAGKEPDNEDDVERKYEEAVALLPEEKQQAVRAYCDAIFDSGADAEQFFYRLGLRDGIRLHKIVKSIIKEIS